MYPIHSRNLLDISYKESGPVLDPKMPFTQDLIKLLGHGKPFTKDTVKSLENSDHKVSFMTSASENGKISQIMYPNNQSFGEDCLMLSGVESDDDSFFIPIEYKNAKKNTYKSHCSRDSSLSPERFSDTVDVIWEKRLRSRKRRKDRVAKLKNNSDEQKFDSVICFKPKKKLKIIQLQPIASFLNPIKSVRFMDYIFPLERSQFDSSTCERKFGPFFGDPRRIKRITSVEHDVENKMWTYHIEERFPQRSGNFKGEETFGYFKEW